MVIKAGEPSVERLVRSADGVRWEQVVPDPCHPTPHTGSSVSEPVPLGGHWLVAYTCTDEVAYPDTPVRSLLYLVGGDGTGPQLLASVERPGGSFGAPLVAGGAVVVPEVLGHGGVGGEVWLLQLRP